MAMETERDDRRRIHGYRRHGHVTMVTGCPDYHLMPFTDMNTLLKDIHDVDLIISHCTLPPLSMCSYCGSG